MPCRLLVVVLLVVLLLVMLLLLLELGLRRIGWLRRVALLPTTSPLATPATGWLRTLETARLPHSNSSRVQHRTELRWNALLERHLAIDQCNEHSVTMQSCRVSACVSAARALTIAAACCCGDTCCCMANRCRLTKGFSLGSSPCFLANALLMRGMGSAVGDTSCCGLGLGCPAALLFAAATSAALLPFACCCCCWSSPAIAPGACPLLPKDVLLLAALLSALLLLLDTMPCCCCCCSISSS